MDCLYQSTEPETTRRLISIESIDIRYRFLLARTKKIRRAKRAAGTKLKTLLFVDPSSPIDREHSPPIL